MSRRYGRNQKRAHRQRIAELEEAYTREQHLLAYNRNQLNALRAEVEDAKRELGRYHIAFQPPVVSQPEVHDRRFRMPVYEDLAPSMEHNFHTMSLTSIVFHVLELNATRERHAAQGDLLHINVALASGHVRYAITEQALACISNHRLIQEVSASLAQQLAVELQRLYPRRK